MNKNKNNKINNNNSNSKKNNNLELIFQNKLLKIIKIIIIIEIVQGYLVKVIICLIDLCKIKHF